MIACDTIDFHSELEQAKSALSRLQKMVEKIEPDQQITSPPVASTTHSSDVTKKSHSIDGNGITGVKRQTKSSLLSNILSCPSNGNTPDDNRNVDVQMAAQHREIERLVESRQRLHTIKDQIASLQQSVTTPNGATKTSTLIDPFAVPSYIAVTIRTDRHAVGKTSVNDEEESNLQNRSRFHYQPTASQRIEEEEDMDSDFYRFGCESGDGEEIDGESDIDVPYKASQHVASIEQETSARIKQGVRESAYLRLLMTVPFL
jgi:hypothetical protein